MTDQTTPSPRPASAGGEQIQNCPFCGDKAYLDYDTETEMFGVEAEHAKGCILKNWDFRCYADEHAAIAAWNRRATTPQAQPDARAVEALRTAQSFIADGGLAESEPGASIYRQVTQALSAPAADDGWRPSREDVARIVSDAIRAYEDHPSQAAFDAREDVCGRAADAILALQPAAPTDTEEGS